MRLQVSLHVSVPRTGMMTSTGGQTLEEAEQKWDVQFRKGSLEMAILALLQQPRYGVEILQQLHQFSSLQISDGTLYPLLERLKREQLIDSEWRQQGDERPRKYYRLSAQGALKLKALRDRWQQSVSDIAALFAQNEAD